MSDWRSIDTAPKDGTLVELRWLRNWVHDYRGTQDFSAFGWYDLRPFGGWRSTTGQTWSWLPTHWRLRFGTS